MKKKGISAVVIGVSGAPGSFSEEAAREYAAKSGLKKFDISYLITVDAVLGALEREEIGLGIIPVANSIGGIVLEYVYASAKHLFKVKDIFSIEIHQNILVKKGVAAEHITTITSHDQALKQCQSYFRRVWPKVKIKEYPDTAKAAKDLSSGELPDTTAVVASKAAAKIYNLDILEASVQDLKTNNTTFVAVTK